MRHIPTREEFYGPSIDGSMKHPCGGRQEFKAVQAIDVTTLTELVGRIERLAAENGELKYALDKAHEDLHQAQRGIGERDECIKKNADELVKYKAAIGVTPSPKTAGFTDVVHSHAVGRYIHADTIVEGLESAISNIDASAGVGPRPLGVTVARGTLIALYNKCKGLTRTNRYGI